MPSSKKELINPVRVFFAIIIAAIIWFAPVVNNPAQDTEAAKAVTIKEDIRSLITVPGVSADPPDVCSDECKVWYCADKIPGGGCREWTFHCAGCDHGGGGTNQPPTISHILTCTLPGANGWCIGNLSLDLTASDPQGSQVIISGDVNGVAFVCPAGNTTCSVPLPEGAGNTNYRVDAATTGLAASGTTTYLLDSSTPYLNGSVSGVAGTGGWYKSNVTLTVAASDAVSGIASTEMTVDGGPWTGYTSPLTFTDGIHTVAMRTTDNAGHVTQTTQTFSIDTVTPVLNIALSGTSGLNNWYVSNVTLTASASDAGSGLASLEVSQDGSTYTNYQSPITFSDGIHSYQFRATDNAGNVTESGQTLNIDTTTPTLNISTTGVAGQAGWYVSNATITPTVSDSTSGIASFEVSQDNSAYTNYQSPITFSDGVHTYQFKAVDNAGNVTETTQTVKVDTITPSLSLNIGGTRGQNDWYTSNATITPTATDATSGIATLEVSQDGSAYAAYQSTSFSDGVHTYQFRVTDNAGNVTETPIQNLSIDTLAPVIEMDDELNLGEYLYYDLEDPSVAGQENSGLSIYRAVIEDDDEKYKKIVWLDGLAGDKKRDSILWDGKFADGAQAGWGSYFITLKISDAAGNERMRTAIVKVGLLSFLEEIPAFTPPASALLPAQPAQTDSTPQTEFGGANSNNATGASTSESSSAGGANNGAAGEGSMVAVTGGTAVFNGKTDPVQSGFSQGNQSTSTPLTNPNILWGTVAAATLGATLADWQRKREEEEARKRAESTSQEDEGGGSGKKKPGRIAYEKKMQQKRIVGESQVLLNEKAREKAEQAEKARQNLIAKNEDRAPVDMAKVNQLVEEKKQADQQAGLAAYYEGRKKGEEDKKPTPWETAVDWVDKHQVEISIGIGVAVGVAAIVLSGGAATPLVAAAWIAGAAIVAGGTVALGTVGLNAYYDRPPTTNVFRNLAIAGGTAAILTGAGFLIPNILQSAGTYCALNTNVCSKVEPVLNTIDTIEESWLIGKGAYQTWIGDSQGAADTAIELQMEHMDGGMPGNSAVKELGGEALELIGKYGDDVLPLVLKYGDDAVDIIGAYGNEGIALLLKYGDKTDEAIALVKEFGTPAIKLLDTVDLISADKLLKTLDADVLDYAVEQGPDAVAALSRWSDKELLEFGPELALRAKNDARALEAINNLVNSGPIDPKHLTPEQKGLIKIIAENSTQYSDEGQIVLGKWVDYGNGFTSAARETGSAHYNPHPDMWKLLEDLGNEQRESTAWLVNKQVVQTGIDKGLPFEYTLDGIPTRDISKEQNAVQLIFSGAPDSEIKSALRLDYVPIRIKELQELQKAGYEFVFDQANNGSFILSLP